VAGDRYATNNVLSSW